MAEWGNTTFTIENNENLCSMGFIIKKGSRPVKSRERTCNNGAGPA